MRFAVPNYLSNTLEQSVRFGVNVAEEVRRSLVPTRYGTTISSLGPVVKNVGQYVKQWSTGKQPVLEPIKGIASVISSGLTDADRQVIWRYTNVPRAAATVTGRSTQFLGPVAGAVAQRLAPIGLMYGAGQLGPLSQGFRPSGYKSIIPVSKEEDPTGRTPVSAPLEAVLRYTTLGGRSQLLPYQQFKEERPDVLPSTYKSYRKYEFSKPKPGELVSIDPASQSFTALGGAVRGTRIGLNDPEIRIKGMPVTASGLLGTAAGIGAASAATSFLTPRSPEYIKQKEAVQKLKYRQNELANAMATRMDIIREAAKQQNVKVPGKGPVSQATQAYKKYTKQSAAEINEGIDVSEFQKWIERRKEQQPTGRQIELFPSVTPTQETLKQNLEQKTKEYLEGIKGVATKVGEQKAGEQYARMFEQTPKLQESVAKAVQKQAELRKGLEPNILQSNRQALGLAAGIGTAVLVGAAAKKLFAKAQERRVKKENPVEYLKYKHGDLATAAQALGQPQARSWQELTPYVK